MTFALDELRPAQVLLVNRRDAARLLGTSVMVVRRLERAGKLTPRRLTGVKGNVYYAFRELLALAEQDVADA